MGELVEEARAMARRVLEAEAERTHLEERRQQMPSKEVMQRARQRAKRAAMEDMPGYSPMPGFSPMPGSSPVPGSSPTPRRSALATPQAQMTKKDRRVTLEFLPGRKSGGPPA